MCELFNQLNAPFPYEDYEVNDDDGRVYIKGQAVAERLNQVLGVGFWRYEPVYESIKTVDTGRKNSSGQPVQKICLLVKFSFYNKELNEWVSFVDAGSQDMNRRMEEGDATKSAITDGLKKCASRIGVASDLYMGKFAARGKMVLLPASYKEYYKQRGWHGIFIGDNTGNQTGQTNTNANKPNKTTQSNTPKSPLQQLKEEFGVADKLFDELKQKYQNNPQKIRQALEYIRDQKVAS